MVKVEVVGANGEVLETIEKDGAINTVDELKELLKKELNILKSLRGKVSVVLQKENGEPLKYSDLPYDGKLKVIITTSGAWRE